MSNAIRRSFRAALTLLLVLGASHVLAEPIRGAGSTFAAPVIAKWSKAYTAARTDGGDFTSPDWHVDYEPVGSLAGIMRLRQTELDFAATDSPLAASEVSKSNLLQFPVVVGGVAIATNIPGIADGQLRLTGSVLADIYLGKIQNWSDMALRELNPGLPLPDLRIRVLHRKDGSGTTYTFTDYLSAVSPEWKSKYGADTLVAWPLGTSAVGTGGVIRAAQEQQGSIAYLEFGQASRAKLPVARLGNKAGEFVQPDPESLIAAVAAEAWKPEDHFFRSLVDQPGPRAYPIAAATYVLIPRDRGEARIQRVIDLFILALEGGQRDAAGLGLVPLPDVMVNAIKLYWANARKAGG
jgi:phosphate transport system substrate-binding protein